MLKFVFSLLINMKQPCFKVKAMFVMDKGNGPFLSVLKYCVMKLTTCPVLSHVWEHLGCIQSLHH